MSTEEKANMITEIDVTYGEGDPWYGFENIEPPTMPANGKTEAIHISIRRGVKSQSTYI
jgi:hypothetical protein